MRRKISWTDGRTDRGKTAYPPPPSGSGGIKMEESVHKTRKPSLPAKENRVKIPEWETIVKS